MSRQLNNGRPAMPYLTRYQLEQIRNGSNDQIARLQAQVAELITQRDELAQEIQTLTGANEALLEANASLNGENRELTQLVSAQNQQIQQNQTQISNLEQQVQTLNAQISLLQEQLAQIQNTIPLWNNYVSLTQTRTLPKTVPSWGFWINGTGTWQNRSVIQYITTGTSNYQYITPTSSSSLWGLWIPDGRLWVLTNGGQEFDIPNVSSVQLNYSSTYEKNSVIFQYSP